MQAPGEQEPLDAMQWRLRMHQLFDSALPNGAYAHSQGLEGLVAEGWIHDEATLEAFLGGAFADALIRVDLPLFRMSHRAAVEAPFELAQLDNLAWATRPTAELRAAATAIGRQTYNLFLKLLPEEGVERIALLEASRHLRHFQSCVVTGALAAHLSIPAAAALAAFAHQALVNMTIPAIKLLQFGPAHTQRVLFRRASYRPHWIQQSTGVGLEDLGASAPAWDIASSRHAYAERRLFIS